MFLPSPLFHLLPSRSEQHEVLLFWSIQQGILKDRQGVSARVSVHSQTFYDCVVNSTIIYVSDMPRKLKYVSYLVI